MKYIYALSIGICTLGILFPYSSTYSQTLIFPTDQPIFDAPQGGQTNTTLTNPLDGSAVNVPVAPINTNTGLPEGVTEQISVTTTPQYPKPGDSVSLLLESFSANVHKARITWYQNGTVIADGSGLVKQNITLPADGRATTFRIVIKKEDGGTIEKVFTIEPAGIDLFYEALTYTPPFYKGKKVFSHQAGVKVITVPQFNSGNRKYTADELVYTWEKNGSVVQEYSGLGQDVLILEADLIPRPIKVTVTVTAPKSDLRAREILTLDLYKPNVHLYENNPLLGVLYTQSLSTGRYTLNRDEVTVIAEPFYFSAEDPSELTYEWSMNGRGIATGKNDNDLVFRNSENITGRTDISARVRNMDKLLQQGQSSLNMSILIPSETAAGAFDF